MMDKTWRFDPLDTLFFRDGKPIDPGESGWLESSFPPLPSTMQGVIRTRILTEFTKDFLYDKKSKNWDSTDNSVDLTKEIGKACQSEDLGKLRLSGPFLVHNEERLYPLPLDICETMDGELVFMAPSAEPTPCDLGNLHLPSASVPTRPLDGAFITENDMEQALSGNIPKLKNLRFLFPPDDRDVKGENILADKEYRIGLARDNARRTHLDGHLYAVSPVRLREGLSFEVDVDNIDSKLQALDSTIQRIGGEGKLTGISITDRHQFAYPDLGDEIDNSEGCFKLVLLTPARIKGGNGWLPDNFEDMEFELLSACIGKALRNGGWNMAKRCSKDMVSYVPAGSVYFLKAKNIKGEDLIKKLRTFRLGDETRLGYGQFLVGTWQREVKDV